MTWMLLPNGAQYHFTNAAAMAPEGRPIDIGNIAHQLALINRFHGATVRPYSVAEHSLLVAEIARRAGATPVVQLAALLHDAHECFTQDLASPAKAGVNDLFHPEGGRPWDLFELDHAHTLRRHFGLLTTYTTHRKALREWDLIALATERRDLTAFDPAKNDPWPVLEGIEPAGWVDLMAPVRSSETWQGWRIDFLTEHSWLRDQVAAQQAATQTIATDDHAART